MTLELCDRGVQPDRFAQVKFITDLIQSVKYFVRAGVGGLISDHGIPQHSVIFKFFSINET